MAQRRMSPEVMKANAKRRATRNDGVVEAIGTAGGGGAGGEALWTASELEQVLVRATEEAQAKGMTDPDKMRDYKLKARDEFKKGRRDSAARRSKEA